MIITKEMKMADIIHHSYQLLPVITRFNIQLGFGDKTVEEVCGIYDVNIDFFIEITNSFIDEDYIPQKEMESFSVGLMVDYLKKTHKYYLEEKMPELERMIEYMSEISDQDADKTALLKNFFLEYKTELENHILREEKKVQPYVLDIEKAFLSDSLPLELEKRIAQYSINDFANEHDNVEEKLFDLKNIIIKYLPPCKDKALCNRILMELFRLEKDLNAHASLEDKVLIPKVEEMEKFLLSKTRNNHI
jgi:regulator of cell morphogenesis and NO signaling